MCWADTLVHPIEAEDNAIALIRFESGAVGQFEVSWTFRGGMDLRDEVAGTEGTIWLDHFLRTGFEAFSSGEGGGYVAEKAESSSGWLFPVGDEIAELGYTDMFTDMFDAMDEGREPMETLYDGYVVNSIIDACYRSAASRQWEPVELEWRGGTTPRIARPRREHDGKTVIKEEKMPDGRVQADPQGRDDGRVRRRRRLGRVTTLSGKRAVVTGSASGIGLAVANALAAAGARVAGLDLRESDCEVPVVGDTSRVEDVERAADALGRASTSGSTTRRGSSSGRSSTRPTRSGTACSARTCTATSTAAAPRLGECSPRARAGGSSTSPRR